MDDLLTTDDGVVECCAVFLPVISELDGLSKDRMVDMVPILPTPTVSANITVCRILVTALHSIELSDFHIVFSFEVPPARVENVISCPKPFIKLIIILV
jgi:hypothetical protein